MIRGEAVGCINRDEQKRLLGQAARVRLGDYQGHIVLESGDEITDSALRTAEELGISGEFYSERIAGARKHEADCSSEIPVAHFSFP